MRRGLLRMGVGFAGGCRSVTDDPRDRGRAVPLADEIATLGGVGRTTQVVYALLRCSGPLTRSELATTVGVTTNRIDIAHRELRERGLLAETATSATDAQRQYFIDPDALTFL